MAKLRAQKGRSTYTFYRRKGKLRRFFVLFLVGIGLICSFFTKGYSLLLLFALLFYQREPKNRAAILAAGEKGEAATQEVLSRLPRRFFVIHDVVIQKPGGQNQLDHLVVTPGGLFVVETKYFAGKIQGSDRDVRVLQKKKWRGGKPTYHRYLNPVYQVATQCRAVNRVLEEMGYGAVSVKGVVYFAHPTAQVRLSSKEAAVFSKRRRGEKKMLRYLKRNGRGGLSKKEMQKIAGQFLKKPGKRG